MARRTLHMSTLDQHVTILSVAPRSSGAAESNRAKLPGCPEVVWLSRGGRPLPQAHRTCED